MSKIQTVQQHPTQEYDRTSHVSSATLSLVLLFAAFGALFYASYIFNPNNIGDWVPYIMVVLAEGLIIFQSFMALWTILAGSYNPRDFRYWSVHDTLHIGPKGKGSRLRVIKPNTSLYIFKKKAVVAVFVTVYGEPLATIERTARAARDIDGEHDTYILDDGKSDEVKALAERLKVKYIRRRTNQGAKAGNINHALRITEHDYFVIFDADHVPKHNFLEETLPFFHDERVAFVQTPQYYANTHNPIASGAAFAQELFYRFICTGKNRFNAAFCVGTNVIFRRTAIDNIGGVYQKSNSEDIWTSILLHEQGYKSVFIPDILAEGEAPETIPAFTKQQLRWATGGFEILLNYNPFTKRLSFDQKMQYFSTATFYLIGVANALLFLVPPMSIFLGLTPVASSTSVPDWALHYLAFYGLQLVVALYCMKGLKPETAVLAIGSFPTYLRALRNVLIGERVGWKATNSHSSESSYDFIVPQIIVLVFLAASTAVGVVEVIGGMQLVSLALAWNIVNMGIFGYYIYLAHHHHGDRGESVTKKPKTEERSSMVQADNRNAARSL